MQFRIRKKEIQKRQRNVLFGTGFSILLCLMTWRGHQTNPEKYNKALLISVFGFIVLFTVISIFHFIRYRLKISKHYLELQEGAILFRTGTEESRLVRADVQSVSRQERWREGPSLVIMLNSGRSIRLVGYDDFETLSARIMETFSEPEPSP